ncbi:hypothetical protein KPL74_11075 [Bacillus sp. NP157]|nr:hypothetical protein KPL74_11075 [Bacillus sp. NP157]
MTTTPFSQAELDRALFAACSSSTGGPAVFALLQAGADPNAEFDDGAGPMSALHLASRHSAQHVHFLLQAGADARRHEATNLGLSCNSVVRTLLVEAGANVNTTDHRGLTALMLAAMLNPSAVPDLLKHGADGSFESHDGRTAAVLCHEPKIRALLESHAEAKRSAQTLQQALGEDPTARTERPRL